MAPLCRWHDLAVVAMWDGGADLAPSAGGSCERPKQTLFGMAFPPIRALPSIKPVCIDEMQAAAGSTFFILKGHSDRLTSANHANRGTFRYSRQSQRLKRSSRGVSATANCVPKWLPPGQMFWAITTTIALAMAAVAILSGRLVRLALQLLTAMSVIFGLLVWLPMLLSNPRSHLNWAGNARTC